MSTVTFSYGPIEAWYDFSGISNSQTVLNEFDG